MDILCEILRLVVPPLVTVVFGAFVAQRFFVSRANEAAMADYMVRELNDLRKDALEYWTQAPDAKDCKQRQMVLEQKIKGTIKGLSADINYYCQRYCKTKAGEMEKLLVEVLDACTGGEFESTKKKTENGRSDNGRYIVIVNTISRVKSELHRRKL